MPDNRLTLTIEAQNLAQAAFKQLQADVRQSNEALKRTDQTARQSSGGIKVFRDELGRLHDATTGQYVSKARLLREGFTEVGQAATQAVGPVRRLSAQVTMLEQLTRAGQELGGAFIKMPGPIGRTSQAIQRAGGSVARLTNQFIGLYRNSGAVRQLGREFRFLQNNIQATSGVVQQFTRNLTAQTQAIVQEAANLERLKLGLVAITGSIQEADTQYRSFLETARTPGVFFRGVFEESLQLQALGTSAEFAERAVRSVGNAIALVGGNEAIFQRALYGLRQIIIDQRVLQRELNIFTQRIPQSIPFLRERYGGARAEDIRETLDAEGIRRTDQSNLFVKELIEFLETLPSASDTASNALENLGDTTRRLQGNIGEGLLPVVKETVVGIENLLLSVEKNESLKTVIADWLAFATAMGTVTAGVVGVAAVIPLLGGLANPIGLTALAAGALAGAFVKAEVASARFRADYNRTQEALRSGLRVGRGEDTEAIGREIERLEARRQVLQAQIDRAEADAQAESDRQPELRRGEPNPLRQSAEDILEASESYQTLNDQLFQVDKTIEVLTRKQDRLGEAAEAAAETATDAVTRSFQLLAAVASGTDAQIAEALQRFENATESANEEVRDLALDIGSQLVSIAEATTESQVRSANRRVQAYARDNSLLVAEDENLKTLLLAAEESFQSNLTRVILAEQAKRFGQGRDTETRQVGSEIQTVLQNLNDPDATPDQLREYRAEFNELTASFQALGGVIPNLEALNTEIGRLINQRAVQANRETFAAGLATAIGDANVEIRGLLSNMRDLESTPDQLRGFNEHLEEIFTNLQNIGVVIPNLQQIRDEVAGLESAATDRQTNDYLAERARAIEAASFKQAQSTEETLQAEAEAYDRANRDFEDKYDARRLFAQNAARAIARGQNRLERLQDQSADAFSSRQLERIQHETAQAIAEYQKRYAALTSTQQRALVDEGAQAQRQYAEQVQSLSNQIGELSDLHDDLGVRIDDAFKEERLERFRNGIQALTQDIISLGLDRFNITDTIADALQDDVPTIRFNAELNEFVFDDSTFLTVQDALAGVTLSAENLSTAVNDLGETLRLRRFEEDAALRLRRLGEDREERLRRLQARLRSVAGRAGSGDQRAIERNIQQQQDIRFQIAEARRDASIQRERFEEDTEIRRNRIIEDALNRAAQAQAQQTSVVQDIGSTLEQALKNALASSLADYLTKTAFEAGISTLSGALSGILSGLGGALGGLLGNILGSGDGEGDGASDTGTDDGAGTGTADVVGTINQLKLSDPPPTAPAINLTGTINALTLSDPAPTVTVDVTGRIAKAELSEGATLPSIPSLKGGISNVVLQQNAQLPLVPGLSASISSLVLDEDIDAPSIPAYEAIINNIIFAEGVTPPALSDYAALIGSIAFAQGVASPTLPAQELLINSVKFSDDIDYPNIPAQALNISSIAFAEGVTVPTLNAQSLSISNITLDPNIDTPTVTGLAGRVDSVALDPSAIPPTVRLPAVAVVGSVAGGQTGERIATSKQKDEDPENPMLDDVITPSLDLSNITQPVELSGVINATLNKLFTEPVIIRGRIVTTGGGGSTPQQSDDGGKTGSSDTGVEDVENYSTIPELSQNLNDLNETLKNVTNKNLNPALGDTPLIDIPDALDKLNQQTNFSDDQAQRENPGFGDILGAHSQFRPGGGGAGAAQSQSALRVAFPREALIGLVNIHTELTTHTKNWIGANQHLAIMRTFITNEMFPALTGIADTLNSIRIATEKTAEAPLVERLVDQGVTFPNDPTDPTNQALVNSPILDILSQSGLSLFAGFDNIQRNLEFLQQGAVNAQPVNLAEMPGGSEGNPLYSHVVNQRDVQDVRLVGGKIESVGSVDSVGEIRKQVNVKQVGTIAVTQSGEWVMRLASGGTIPVYVQGGRLVANIEGGLEGLAVQLADTEVGLQAVGAI